MWYLQMALQQDPAELLAGAAAAHTSAADKVPDNDGKVQSNGVAAEKEEALPLSISNARKRNRQSSDHLEPGELS